MSGLQTNYGKKREILLPNNFTGTEGYRVCQAPPGEVSQNALPDLVAVLEGNGIPL